jgi:general secretion pathway protein I
MKPPCLAGSSRGFSLLEMLVAFTIMAFSLAALYQASGGAVRTLGETDQYQRATLLAQSLLSTRDGVPPAGWQDTGRSGGLEWRVSSAPFASPLADPLAPKLHKVDIVVGWEDRRGPRQFSVSTLLPQVASAPGSNAR